MIASQRQLQNEADRFAPRLRRAFVKATDRMKARVALMKLADALSAKDVSRALLAVGEDELETTMRPFEAIVRDAFGKGGKIGAKLI